MWTLVILIIIIIIAILLKLYNSKSFYITNDAKALFAAYIQTHELAKNKETKCSGINNIIDNIDDYFKIELKEEDHKDIADDIIRDRGLFDADKMQRWINENYHEVYELGEVECEEGLLTK
jgi:hypothetical protein